MIPIHFPSPSLHSPITLDIFSSLKNILSSLRDSLGYIYSIFSTKLSSLRDLLGYIYPIFSTKLSSLRDLLGYIYSFFSTILSSLRDLSENNLSHCFMPGSRGIREARRGKSWIPADRPLLRSSVSGFSRISSKGPASEGFM